MKLRAPWAADNVLEEVLAHPRKWKSERLGRLLGLTGKEWRELRIRIAPVDMPAKERRGYSRIFSNGKRLKKRRTKGMMSRAEYREANSLSRTKPWVAEGISRRTWERRRRRDASLAAIHKNNAKDRPATAGMAWNTFERWVFEHGSSPTQLPATPDLCPFFIPKRIPGALNLIPYGRLVSLAEIRSALGYRQ